MCRESSISPPFLLHKSSFSYLTSSCVNSRFPQLIPDKQPCSGFCILCPPVFGFFLWMLCLRFFTFLLLFIAFPCFCTQLLLVNWFSTSVCLSIVPSHLGCRHHLPSPLSLQSLRQWRPSRTGQTHTYQKQHKYSSFCLWAGNHLKDLPRPLPDLHLSDSIIICISGRAVMEPHFLAQMLPSNCYLGLLGLQLELAFWLSAGQHRLQLLPGLRLAISASVMT